VNTINDVTKGYSLYRQIAFIAQTIWESGGYRYNEELAATTGSQSTRFNYQQCTDGSIAPTSKAYYGRGFIQLSWCYNYEAYGRARNVNGNRDYFKQNPDLVAQLPYAVDSAAWFFESNVPDNSGQFGLTTRSINGGIECNGSGHHAPPKRYQIFEALAQRVGLTGYSSAGC